MNHAQSSAGPAFPPLVKLLATGMVLALILQAAQVLRPMLQQDWTTAGAVFIAAALVLGAVALGERDVPDYIEADHKKMTAKFVRVPALADVPYPVTMEPHLVVEFYSR